MGIGIKQPVSPQNKLIQTNQRMGVRGINKMQGTTRMIWDSVEVAGNKTLRFFKNANQQGFPFTNLQKGNRLEVGESLVINYMNFTLFNYTEEGDIYDKWGSISSLLADPTPFALGELNILIANTQVMKPIALNNFLPDQNKASLHENQENFYFDTQIVIPPLVEFEVNLQLPDELSDDPNTWCRCTIEGVGSIVAPRQTF